MEKLELELENTFSNLLSLDRIDLAEYSTIGGKARNLVLIKKRGISVPSGYCIPASVHKQYVEKEIISETIYSDVLKAKAILGGKVIIRSSANCEDGSDLSMAGVFLSLRVYDDSEVQHSINCIFSQARSVEVDRFMMLHGKDAKSVEMALIVQQLIEPELSGVVYTGVNGNNLLIEYVRGFGSVLADGDMCRSSLLVDNIGNIIESVGYDVCPLPSDVLQQIHHYAFQIENIFYHEPQDIEFTYVNGQVYIVQARQLTTDLGIVRLRESQFRCLETNIKGKIRNLITLEKHELGLNSVVFSDANYSELLPQPSEMDIGLYMYVWGGYNGLPGAKQLGHAEVGYKISSEAIGIINYIGGRTYASIARYSAHYYIGFPSSKQEYFSSLVQEYLDTVEADPVKGSYIQMGLILQDPSLEDLHIRFGKESTKYFRIYQEFAINMRLLAQSFASEFYTQRLPETKAFIEAMGIIIKQEMNPQQILFHAKEVLEHIRKTSNVDFVKAARLGFYYSQRLQYWIQSKLGYNDNESKRIFAQLNQGLEGSAITDANIAIATASTEEDAIAIAYLLIGHFSSGEMLEIRHLPLRDNERALKEYVRGIRKTGKYLDQIYAQRIARLAAEKDLYKLVEGDTSELQELISYSQTYMSLRETTKYLYTKEYLILRDLLEILESKMRLNKGDIYFLYPWDLDLLIDSPQSILHLIVSRKQSFKNYENFDMPSIIREADVDSIGLVTDCHTEFIEASGELLADGSSFEGIIVNLEESGSIDCAEDIIQQYLDLNILVILVARQMNLNHDPLIAQVAGLIIENASIVAHGAQRSRELGKGAIGGIKVKQLITGTKVFFDPRNQVVRKLQQTN
jgi:phosphohistidine swiveling domain-containing protein